MEFCAHFLVLSSLISLMLWRLIACEKALYKKWVVYGYGATVIAKCVEKGLQIDVVRMWIFMVWFWGKKYIKLSFLILYHRIWFVSEWNKVLVSVRGEKISYELYVSLSMLPAVLRLIPTTSTATNGWALNRIMIWCITRSTKCNVVQ